MNQISNAFANVREQLNERNMTQMEIDQINSTASVLINTPSQSLPNPLDVIDKLHTMSPFFGNRALTNFTSSLGYYVVNALLWQYRKDNARPSTESTIDWRNRTEADKDIEAATASAIDETSAHVSLPRVDGLQFIANYKQLLFALEDKKLDNKQFQFPDPITIFNQMKSTKNQPATDAAYDSLAYANIKSEDVKRRLHVIEETRKAAFIERNETHAGFELDHILGEIGATKAEHFTDADWARLPRYIQYRTIVGIQKQVMGAFVSEMRKPSAERTQEFNLGEFADELQADLQQLLDDPEIVLAFDEGKLDATRHSIQ